MPSVPFKYSVAHVSHGREHSEYESLFQFQKAFELKALASMVLQTVDETLPYMDRHIIASAPSVADLLPEALKDEAGEASLAVLASPAQLWPGRGTATFSASYYEGSMDNLSVVADWVARNRFPGVWALGEGNFYEFTHSDRPAVLVALGPEVGEDLEQEIRGAQREFSQEFLFGALNGSHWSEELKMFNIHPQEPGPHSARAAPQQQLLGSHSVAPADLNAPYSRAELKRVKAVRFTMFDADTLTAYSVAEISSNEIYRNGQPVHGGVNDPRLGPIDVRTPCETCGQGIKSCPGHWGHLTLARPMQGPRRAD
eukprot:s166_g4.t1